MLELREGHYMCNFPLEECWEIYGHSWKCEAVFVTKDGRAMYSPNEETTIPLMKRVQDIWKIKYPEYYEESGS
jgi:hypothetical protein